MFTVVAAPKNSIEERFYSKVKKTKSCWVWQGYTTVGYGRLYFYEQNRYIGAHRLSLMLTGVNIPKSMVVDHICRNRACVNPKHLRVVTPRQNVLENSESITAKNRAKTHCIRGHEFTPENLIPRSSGHRTCRACNNLLQNKRNRERAKKRGPIVPKRQTHCHRGHPFNKTNTYVPPKKPNQQQCRICRRANQRKRNNAQP